MVIAQDSPPAASKQQTAACHAERCPAARETKEYVMSVHTQQVLADALKLSPVERAELVERILDSFRFPERKKIDGLWADEAEERIAAYDHGGIDSKPASRVFERIEKDEL